MGGAGGNEGTLTIASAGGDKRIGSGYEYALESIIPYLSHKVTLTGTTTKEGTFPAGTTPTLKVQPGTYTVTVEAYCSSGNVKMIYGIGSKEGVEVLAAQSVRVSIQLQDTADSATFIPDDWDQAFGFITDYYYSSDPYYGGNGTNKNGKYCIILTKTNTSGAFVTLEDPADILIIGNNNIVKLLYSGSLLDIYGSGINVTLQDVNLVGINSNTAPLVCINDGGSVTMNGNSSISGNTTSSNGGGVYVYDGSRFTMNGGTISGNVALSGGGVFVDDDGIFIMNGGSVTNNTPEDVYNDGGKISGSAITGTLANGW
jgi:parallel beta-helix repeat protein